MRRYAVNEDNKYCNTGCGWDFFAAKLAKAGDLIIKAVWMPRSDISLYVLAVHMLHVQKWYTL